MTMIKRSNREEDDFTPHIPITRPPPTAVSQLKKFTLQNQTALCVIVLTFIVLASIDFNGKTNFTVNSDQYFRRSQNNVLDLTENKQLSRKLLSIANVNEPLRDGDVPLFLHFHRSGGGTIKDIMGGCLGLTLAGAAPANLKDKELKVLHNEDGSTIINVDTRTPEGIEHAKELNLIDSDLANVVITQQLYPAASLFDNYHRGRLFVIMRHPVERAVSQFHYLGLAMQEPNYDPDLAYISIEMYARSQRLEHNWMTRVLSNQMSGELTPEHLDLAKSVLKRKALVALLSRKGEGLKKFDKYFGWNYGTGRARECRERYLNWNWPNKQPHPVVTEGSAAWELLEKQNNFDMELYEFAKTLHKEQNGRRFWRRSGITARLKK